VRSDLHFDLHKRLADAGVTIAATPTPATSVVLQLPSLEKLAAEREFIEAGRDAPPSAEPAAK
jgi:hypothetical protein